MGKEKVQLIITQNIQKHLNDQKLQKFLQKILKDTIKFYNVQKLRAQFELTQFNNDKVILNLLIHDQTLIQNHKRAIQKIIQKKVIDLILNNELQIIIDKIILKFKKQQYVLIKKNQKSLLIIVQQDKLQQTRNVINLQIKKLEQLVDLSIQIQDNQKFLFKQYIKLFNIQIKILEKPYKIISKKCIVDIIKQNYKQQIKRLYKDKCFLKNLIINYNQYQQWNKQIKQKLLKIDIGIKINKCYNYKYIVQSNQNKIHFVLKQNLIQLNTQSNQIIIIWSAGQLQYFSKQLKIKLDKFKLLIVKNPGKMHHCQIKQSQIYYLNNYKQLNQFYKCNSLRIFLPSENKALLRYIIQQGYNCQVWINNINSKQNFLMNLNTPNIKRYQIKSVRIQKYWYWNEYSNTYPYNPQINKKLNKQLTHFILNSKEVNYQGKPFIYKIKQNKLYSLTTNHVYNLINKNDIIYIIIPQQKLVLMLTKQDSQKFKIPPPKLIKKNFFSRLIFGESYEPPIQQIKMNLVYYLIDIQKKIQINLLTRFVRKINYQQKIFEKIDEKQQIINLKQLKFTIYQNIKKQSISIFSLNKEKLNLGQKIIKQIQDKNKFQKQMILQQGQLDYLNTFQKNNIQIKIIDKNKVILKSYSKQILNNNIMQLQKIRLISINKPIQQQKIQIKYPRFWINQKSPISVFQVYRGQQEYNLIQQLFKISPIKKLERIQNSILFKKYYFQKQSLESLTQTFIHVKQLFHGTSSTDPKIIYQDKEESFNINYARDGMLGVGIYFAKEAAYSNSYAYKCLQGKSMFLCSVQIGRSQQRAPSSRIDTDYIPGTNRIRYQSVHSYYGDSDIYVVYKSRRAYPQYLITY